MAQDGVDNLGSLARETGKQEGLRGNPSRIQELVSGRPYGTPSIKHAHDPKFTSTYKIFFLHSTAANLTFFIKLIYFYHSIIIFELIHFFNSLYNPVIRYTRSMV